MTQVEYDRLLDIVQGAIDTDDYEFSSIAFPKNARAANDNQIEWPLMPFPDGWHASA